MGMCLRSLGGRGRSVSALPALPGVGNTEQCWARS